MSPSLSNFAERINVGLYPPERQLKLVWRDKSNGGGKDVIGRWVLQRKNEDEFQTLTFTSAFEFGETHRDLHLRLENPVRTREIDLPNLAVLANLDEGADVSRDSSSGRKQSLGWELERLHARRKYTGGRSLSRQNRSSDQRRTEPGQQTLTSPHASSLSKAHAIVEMRSFPDAPEAVDGTVPLSWRVLFSSEGTCYRIFVLTMRSGQHTTAPGFRASDCKWRGRAAARPMVDTGGVTFGRCTKRARIEFRIRGGRAGRSGRAGGHMAGVIDLLAT